MKPAREQVVEFSLLLPEEKYSSELSDPFTEEYQKLSQQFVSEVISLPLHFPCISCDIESHISASMDAGPALL